jgi:hypothetical protein
VCCARWSPRTPARRAPACPTCSPALDPPSGWNCCLHTDVYLDGFAHAEKLTATEIVTALPVPLVDPTDVAATVLSATVLSQPVQTLDSLRPPGTAG